MDGLAQLQNSLIYLIPLLALLIIWELVWKLLAMWRAGRNNQLGWFICLALINSCGILPIIYLLITRKKTDQ